MSSEEIDKNETHLKNEFIEDSEHGDQSSAPTPTRQTGRFTNRFRFLVVRLLLPSLLFLLATLLASLHGPWYQSDEIYIGSKHIEFILQEGDYTEGALARTPTAVLFETNTTFDKDYIVYSPAWNTTGDFSLFVTDGLKLNQDDKSFTGEVRYRLGDVHIADSDKSYTAFMAAIFDERFILEERYSEGKANVADNSISMLDWWLSPAYAESGFDQIQQKLSNVAAPDTRKSPETEKEKAPLAPSLMSGTLVQGVQDVEQNTEESINKNGPEENQLRTSPVVLTSATISFLYQADARGIQRVLIPVMGLNKGLNLEQAVNAISRGISQVESRLSSVKNIVLLSDDHEQVKTLMESSSSSIVKRVNSAMSMPTEQDINRENMYSKSVDESEDPTRFPLNPAYLYISEDTSQPMWAMLVLAMSIGFIRLMSADEKTDTSVTASLLPVVGGFLIMYLGYIVLPIMTANVDQAWMSSEAGLVFFAAIPGVLSGLMLGRIRVVKETELEEDATESAGEKIRQYLKMVLHRDIPVESVSGDKLNFAPLARALSRFFDNKDTLPPVVLGVNGPWGSGKSSLMKMLAGELKDTRRWKTVWFNAWRYQKQDQILAAFLQEISRELTKDWNLLFAFRLALVRFKQLGFWQYVVLLFPLAIVVMALVKPDEVIQLMDSGGKYFKDTGKWGYLFASILGIGGSTWMVKFFLPFRMSFRKLWKINDQSQRLGFLDEFTREFKLYREAVKNYKFLIIIDDLDRCSPDRVVEVMKVINLIVTSGDGAGQSFFVLGYDPKYILRSIELEFKDYAEIKDLVEQRFGIQYLKKMVTLSVSVPQVQADQVQNLVENMTPSGIDEGSKEHRSWRKWFYSLPKNLPYVPKLLTAILVLSMAASIGLNLISKQYPGTPEPDGKRGSQKTEMPVRPDGFQQRIIEVQSPAITSQKSLLNWAPTAVLGIMIFGLFVYRRLSDQYIREEVKDESKDPPAFTSTIKMCQQLLPANPRDAIRLINLMRMEYLIQEPEASSDEEQQSSLPGEPLSERECVIFTLLRARHPKLFDPGFVSGILMKELKGQAHDNPLAFYQELSQHYDSLEKIIDDIGHIMTLESRQFKRVQDFKNMLPEVIDANLQEIKECMKSLTNPGKLERYVNMNRFLLDIHGMPNSRVDIGG